MIRGRQAHLVLYGTGEAIGACTAAFCFPFHQLPRAAMGAEYD
ncbi:hypothetical protein CP97_14732 [Aurantiacibacter atlanticus]|uniref:Uncharacterized protein n=1 Tax=Aurantiacibacter atlanticus TaxID=1648404 RepID=A0A168M1M8_9SPHN|nr:hypothetical protein CP97_14732 [Aurantiacibacter atlanticus]